VKQDPNGGDVCADPEKRRRSDRLELAGQENLQSIARVPAVAGRVQFLSRADISYLAIARSSDAPNGEPGQMIPHKRSAC
jgi:hypothetical protein